MPNETITPSSEYDTWDQGQAILYRRYGLNNRYRIHSGLMALPVAEDPPTDPGELAEWSPVVFVRVHADFRERTVEFDIEKQVNPPVLPSPTDTGSFRFVGGTVNLPVPTPNNSLRNFDWKAAGEYTMIEDAPVGKGYVLGMTPWVYQTQDDNAARYGSLLVGLGPAAQVLAQSAIGAVEGAGAALSGGIDVGVGLAQAQQIDTQTTYWMYSTPSYFPGNLQNDSILNGGPTTP